MIHQRQSLPFNLEARYNLVRVHPYLDELQRDPSSNRRRLLRQIDHTHPTFAQLLQDRSAPGARHSDYIWRWQHQNL